MYTFERRDKDLFQHKTEQPVPLAWCPLCPVILSCILMEGAGFLDLPGPQAAKKATNNREITERDLIPGFEGCIYYGNGRCLN